MVYTFKTCLFLALKVTHSRLICQTGGHNLINTIISLLRTLQEWSCLVHSRGNTSLFCLFNLVRRFVRRKKNQRYYIGFLACILPQIFDPVANRETERESKREKRKWKIRKKNHQTRPPYTFKINLVFYIVPRVPFPRVHHGELLTGLFLSVSDQPRPSTGRYF